MISVLDLRVKKIGCEHFNYNSATFLGKVVRRLFYNNLSAIVLLTKSDARNYSFLDAKKYILYQILFHLNVMENIIVIQNKL